MRRSSRRVFGARVLRSGRRVMTSSPSEAKHVKETAAGVWVRAGAGPIDCEEWINILESSRESGIKVKFSEDDVKLVKKGSKIKGQNLEFVREKKWGIVYSRKRKRIDCENANEDRDRKFGKYYVRKRYVEKRYLGIVVKSISSGGNGLLGGFLVSVLRYMGRDKLSLLQLSAFALSESFAYAYLSCGIRILRDSVSNKRYGICKVYRSSRSSPSFMVDFTALPSSFMYMHTSLSLRSPCLLHFLLSYPTNLENDEMVVNDEEIIEAIHQKPCISTFSQAVNVNPVKKTSLRTSGGSSRRTGRSVQFKSCVITRSIKKRRSSLRSSRVKSSSGLRGHVANLSFLSDLSSVRHDIVPFARESNFRLNSARRSTSLKSSLVELTKNIGSASCSANILVVESAKCYRIAGALIKLEKSISRKWSLAVKKDGKTIYSLNTKKIMRPCSSNRVTHDIIWREENNNWKLEFSDRGDWAIFKELYKECWEQNMRALPANIIPVPGVEEVSGYAETNGATFSRPNLYITVRDGELSRALSKETENYDMDSEDEEWVKKFNEDSSSRNDHWDYVSENTFEMLIDALERAFFCNPDDNFDDKEALNSCLHLERTEVIEAVYSYWMRKRKQKGLSLIRVFQCYQPKKTQLLSKPFVRKKRSFKRQPSRIERAYQRPLFPVVAPEPDPVEEQKALLKLEEPKAAAARSLDAAIEKRNKAQILMEKADLAIYKATMALRIAESSQIAESFDVSQFFFT